MNIITESVPGNIIRQPEILPSSDFTIHPNHILVPTDFSARSMKALEHAIKLAERFDAQLTLLHVYDMPHSLEYLRGDSCARVIGEDRERARQRLTEIYSKAYAEYAKCGICFVSGSLGEEIARAIEDLAIDLVVICSRKPHWFTHLAEGSEVEKILRRSLCPILVVPEDD